MTFLGVLLLLVACNRTDQEIKVYRVAKAPLDSAPERDTGAPADAAALAFSPGAVPPNWESQPLSQMRQASFLVHGENGSVADISFVTLGPSAGNLLDNVNRWLSQLAQPPVTEEALAKTVQQLPTSRGNLAVVDLTGEPENADAKKDGRIIAAIGSDAGGTAFFKMRGNRELAGAEKENFLKWATSSRDSNSSTKVMEKAPASPDSAAPQIKWELPAGWLPGPASAMRYASFIAEENGEKADISVVTFAGDGGGDLDNVNRWRQQIGLAPVETSALNAMITPVTTNATSFSTVDLAGAAARTIAGWSRHDGRVWFFKLTGSKTAVERERTKFVQFIQSVRF
jgi:hypothetical protein